MPDLDTTSILSDDLTVSDLGFNLLSATAPPDPDDLATIDSNHEESVADPEGVIEDNDSQSLKAVEIDMSDILKDKLDREFETLIEAKDYYMQIALAHRFALKIRSSSVKFMNLACAYGGKYRTNLTADGKGVIRQNKIKEQYDRANRKEPLEPCRKYNRMVYGLPCAHEIKKRNAPLQLGDVDKHWHLRPDIEQSKDPKDDPLHAAINKIFENVSKIPVAEQFEYLEAIRAKLTLMGPIQSPLTVATRGRRKLNTKRNRSHFEHVDEMLEMNATKK
ncbi:hypothetical protein BX616_004189, partial [Lobosporangium transversale]